jgi:hypothetical protein
VSYRRMLPSQSVSGAYIAVLYTYPFATLIFDAEPVRYSAAASFNLARWSSIKSLS